MSMSKKDFVALARGLRQIRPQADPEDLVETARRQIKYEMWMSCVNAVASVCVYANPNFDRDRFYWECGYYEPFIREEDEL